MRGRFRSNGWLQPCDRDGVLEKGFRSWGFQRLSANACGNCTEKYFSTKVCFRNQQKCKTGALRPRMPYRMSFLEEFVCSEPKISKWRRRDSKREQTGTKRKPKAPKREFKEGKRKPKWSQREPKGCQKTQRVPKGSQRMPKGSGRATKMDPKIALGAKVDFGSKKWVSPEIFWEAFRVILSPPVRRTAILTLFFPHRFLDRFLNRLNRENTIKYNVFSSFSHPNLDQK